MGLSKQFSMYKISIYNMCSVTVHFYLLFRFFTETLSGSKNDLMPKGLLGGGGTIYLKSLLQVCLSNITVTKKTSSMSHILFS